MMIGLFSLILSLSFASAETPGCEFVPRSSAKEILSAMPPEVIGWANCTAQVPGLILIARLPTEAAADDLILKITSLVVQGEKPPAIVRRIREPSGLLKVFAETPFKAGEAPMIHYGFTGADVLFIHSRLQNESRRLMPKLEALRLQLTGPAFLQKLR